MTLRPPSAHDRRDPEDTQAPRRPAPTPHRPRQAHPHSPARAGGSGRAFRLRHGRRAASLAATAALVAVAAAGISSGFDISDTGPPAPSPTTQVQNPDRPPR